MEAPAQILYLDNHLLAVNKPAGVLTQPTESQEASLEIAIKQWLKHTYQKPGNLFLGVLHRLDRQASGVVLFARTSKALVRMNAAIQAGDFQKRYHAWVEGAPAEQEGEFADYLCHGDHRACLSHARDPAAKLARLRYSVLEKKNQFSLIQIQLLTGRYHQIRAQFSARGMPILGDSKYGSKYPFPGPGIALHHRQLQFTHPVSKATIEIEAPYPTEWKISSI